jgi:hypothetical protein
LSLAANTAVDWDSIDTVLLDMDGTLLDLHFDNYFWTQHLPKRYSEMLAVPLHEINADIAIRLQQKQGTLAWYCTDYWSREFALDIIAIKSEIKHLICERPQVLKFLEKIGAMGKRRVLVTNADRASIALKFSCWFLICWFFGCSFLWCFFFCCWFLSCWFFWLQFSLVFLLLLLVS